MQQRIDNLRAEIARLYDLAKSCDRDIAAKMHALAADMERTAKEMQERLDALARGNR